MSLPPMQDIAPAARIADAIDGDAALVRRATDALDHLDNMALEWSFERQRAYSAALSSADCLRMMNSGLDHAARDAQRKKREAK